MGKLNIAHHKSYHPYRLDNIERVRRDEAAANLKKSEDADRALVAVRRLSLQLLHTYPIFTRTPSLVWPCSVHAQASLRRALRRATMMLAGYRPTQQALPSL
jgi:N-terminal domain of CBF1 interacting co-repressor CIR